MTIKPDTSNDNIDADFSMIGQALEALYGPMNDGIVELRILNTPHGTVSGYYEDMNMLAAHAVPYSGHAPAVYTTLNPVNPDLKARAYNRITKWAKHTTSDKDILYRLWLPVDFDPVRPSGISSTDAEHTAALERAKECRDWLLQHGWPDPIYADSGNGAHPG